MISLLTKASPGDYNFWWLPFGNRPLLLLNLGYYQSVSLPCLFSFVLLVRVRGVISHIMDGGWVKKLNWNTNLVTGGTLFTQQTGRRILYKPESWCMCSSETFKIKLYSVPLNGPLHHWVVPVAAKCMAFFNSIRLFSPQTGQNNKST
jgi:hypothetical protein